ncbi:hypothetical protein FGO68_gene2477 [Halteria grandinella]|uniref:Uncharacterized protein n=1 Tax=Halteria grandinella TaxID=5974 RepID=A0A8J8T4Y8_HALGN|nr:hypothetical protein FGO68_gene2477 [Halteria grandinella]
METAQSLSTALNSRQNGASTSEGQLQSYLPYSIANPKTQFEMKTLLALSEQTAVKSIGYKKKISKLEVLRVLTQPDLSPPEVGGDLENSNDLRGMLVDVALSIFDVDYLLDALISSFFFSYTYFRLHHSLFISETLSLLTKAHSTHLNSSKLVLFANSAEQVMLDHMETFSKRDAQESERENTNGSIIQQESIVEESMSQGVVNDHEDEQVLWAKRIVKMVKEMKIRVLKQQTEAKGENLMYVVIRGIEKGIEEKELAARLDQIDRQFVKSLRMTDFFNQAGGGQWKPNFKIVKYLEYQKALYQTFRQFILSQSSPIIVEENQLASPKGSIHSLQEVEQEYLLSKSFAVSKLITTTQHLLELGNFNTALLITQLLTADREITSIIALSNDPDAQEALQNQERLASTQYEELLQTERSNYKHKSGSPTKVLVFTHLLAFMESFGGSAVGIIEIAELVEGDRVNLEGFRKVWGTVDRYLSMFN